MATNYDNFDLSWSWKGDFKIADGDIGINYTDALESVETEIITVVKSTEGDWELHPLYGSNLAQFIGEPNTRENAERMKDVLKTAISSAGIARRQDLIVEINALTLHTLYIRITLRAEASPANRLMSPSNNPLFQQKNEGMEIKFLFDTNTSAIYY